MLRFLTAGESHGPALVAMVEGLPAGIRLDPELIQHHLWRRQQGYGRGARQKIEQDAAEILTGVRFGETLGGPVALIIKNRDFENWGPRMAAFGDPAGKVVTRPRPGHADLAGLVKYGREDIRDVLERASARETAARVALGAIVRQLLLPFGVRIHSHVLELGGIVASLEGLSDEEIFQRAEASPVRTADPEAEERMLRAIDVAQAEGDSLGGVFEVVATGLPVGLGSHVSWDRKLDGRLAQAVMSIQAVKGVEVGPAFASARLPGSKVHDEIVPGEGPLGLTRRSNRAGGLEGGITNGQNLLVRGAMKPLSTLRRPLASVDVKTGEVVRAGVERTDVTALPAAGVVAEAMVAWVLADAFLEKFGGDSMAEIRRNYDGYMGGLPR